MSQSSYGYTRGPPPSRVAQASPGSMSGPSYSYARHQPIEPSLTSPPLSLSSPSPISAGSSPFYPGPTPPPPNFAQTQNPYAGDASYDSYPISSSAAPLQPLLTPSAPSFTPSATPFVPLRNATPPPLARPASTSPTVQKRTLDPGAKTWNQKPATAPPSESDFPSLSAAAPSPTKPTPASSSKSKTNATSHDSKGKGKAESSNGKVESTLEDAKPTPSKSSERGGGGREVDLTTLIDQLYAAAEQIKNVQSTQEQLAQASAATEKELMKERQEREQDQKRFQEEQKKLLEEQERKLRANANDVKGKGTALVTIHRGIQVDPLPLPSLSISRPRTPPRSSSPSSVPPVASTSSAVLPSASSSTAVPSSSTSELDSASILEYQTLAATVQLRLAQVEQEKIVLDHRIAQMVQEKEALWPEQRQVLMQRAEADKREIEKKLEKALKRVEVLEKDRPAPVLRIGGGPPKSATPKSKASETPTGPDPRLVQLEARITEIESDLTEATVRASTAEEALEEYQTRTDKLLEAQQTQIDTLSLQKDKAQESTLQAERKCATIKKKAQEMMQGHQVALRERKSAEDEARNEMLRYKDELKKVQEELDKEVQKSTRDLAASERRKIEAKHQSVRESEQAKFEKELSALRAQLERERKAHEYELDERGLSHGEELGDLEYQLRDETEQHAREIDSLKKKHESELEELRTQLAKVNETLHVLHAETRSTSSANGMSSGSSKPTPLTNVINSISSSTPARTRTKTPLPRASLADQTSSARDDYSRLGEDIVKSGLASLD